MGIPLNPNDSPPPVSYRLKGRTLKAYLDGIEFRLIAAAMREAGQTILDRGISKGQVSLAARLLGVNRTTLIEKLKKYQIKKNELVS